MFNTIIGVLLIIMAVFLVIAVLMQNSKDHRHGGTVAGGAETFFGKNKGRTMEAKLVKLTKIIGIGFFVIAFAAKVLTTIF